MPHPHATPRQVAWLHFFACHVPAHPSCNVGFPLTWLGMPGEDEDVDENAANSAASPHPQSSLTHNHLHRGLNTAGDTIPVVNPSGHSLHPLDL